MNTPLFDLPERRPVDPPVRRTAVRAHERTLTPRARTTDPVTSVRAAQSVTRGRIEARILPVLEKYGPSTKDEIAAHLPWENPPTISTALSRLRDAGSIVDTGVTRLSNRGRSATVWSLV